MRSSSGQVTELLINADKKLKKKSSMKCPSTATMFCLMTSFGLLSGAMYVGYRNGQEARDASNILKNQGNNIWEQAQIEGNGTIFNISADGSCIVVTDLPCNYSINTPCNVFDPFMMNCNSRYHNNLTIQLAKHNPAPYTTPLDKRLGLYFPDILSNYTTTCDKATTTAGENLSPGAIMMMIGGAMLFAPSVAACGKEVCKKEPEVESENTPTRTQILSSQIF